MTEVRTPSIRREHPSRWDGDEADTLTLDSWQDAPANRWAFTHVGELVPTARIARRIPEAAAGLGTLGSRIPSLERRLVGAYTDAFLVTSSRGTVAEWYRDGLDATTPHLLMSVSKSLCAIVVGTLVDEGALDPAERIASHVPSLAGSAYGAATLQQVLDMVVSVAYSEDYRDPDSEVQAQDRVAGWRPRRTGDQRDTYEFLRSLRASGDHGRVFQYCSAGTDVLSWTIENVTGERYADVLSARLWSQLDCRDDAAITVDAGGFAFANGGISCTARDLARVGLLMLGGGAIDGRRVVSEEWVEDTLAGGDPVVAAGSMFQRVHPDGSYRNQWWVTGNDRANVYAVGIHGQYIWLDPPTGTVIVKLSSCPEPVTEGWNRLHADLFREVCEALG